MLCKKGVLRNFAKFTGKYRCQRLFFNKVAGLRPATSSKMSLRPATLLKKSLWYRWFPVNFSKFLRTPFLKDTSDGYFSKSFTIFIKVNWRFNRGLQKWKRFSRGWGECEGGPAVYQKMSASLFGWGGCSIEIV